MNLKKLCLLVFSLACCLQAQSLRAGLLAYEGFNYPPGTSLTNASDLGGDGSYGWAGRWTGASVSLATNAAGSLLYIDALGNTLKTNGGRVLVGVPAGTTANAQPSRSLALGTLNGTLYTGLTNSPGTYWVSFLMQWVGPATAGSSTNLFVRKGDLNFRAGCTTNAGSSGSSLFAIGSPNAANRLGTPVDTWATWNGNDAGAGTQNSGLAATALPLTNCTFVLIRFDLTGNNLPDSVYTWFNWTNLASEPALASANTVTSITNQDGLNNIRLDANGGNAAGTNTVLAVDEFRLGTSFADVAPYGTGAVAPTITRQPQSVSATLGDTVAFSVTATSTVPLVYQWFFNTNTPLSDATNSTLTLSNIAYGAAGAYSVMVSDGTLAATSEAATLTVLAPVLPSILSQPQSLTNIVGMQATFVVSADGTAPLSYQWYHNDSTRLPNQTNATLSFSIAGPSDSGSYWVSVSNRFSSLNSQPATLTVVPASPAGLPAFSGADGAAEFVSGGRGGIVYHVTSLDRNYSDTNAGTLRYGLTDSHFPLGVPRTIVFDVAGVFWLGRYGAESNYDNGWNAGQSRYTVPANITLAGQTAPGPVVIMGGMTSCGATNVIMRNILFAPGYGMQGFHEPPADPTPGDFPDSYSYDAVDINGQNVLLDHLTSLFTTDEAISCNELANNLTVQYCNVSQGQNYPQADAEASSLDYTGHALAHLLQAGSNAKISIHHNLYAHMKGRLPRVGSEVGTGPFNDFRNNVTYNWLSTAGTGSSGQPSFNNFVNNFYLAGPGGDNPIGGTNFQLTAAAGGTAIFNGESVADTRAYVSGNLKDINKDGDPNDATSADGDFTSISAQAAAYDVNQGATLSARNALTNVLHYVGARWWARPYDFVLNNTQAIQTNDIACYLDERLIHETITGTGKIRAWADDPFNSDPTEGTEWRALLALRADTLTYAAPFSRPAGWDSDGDGMPDDWEIEHGLDPYVPNNNGDFDNDGYTDLEEYLNELAAWPAPGPVYFTGSTNSRYAQIFNWQVSGEQLTIAGKGAVTSSSLWQPSRFDTAVISNATAVVDAVGQHAGTLQLLGAATLNVTNGWLKIANTLSIGAGSTTIVKQTGSLTVATNLVNNGTLRLSGSAQLNLGGTFTNNGVLDLLAWNGSLPAGLVNHGTILDHSLLRVAACQIQGQDFQLTIQGYSGHSYQLQSCDDLAGGRWTDQGVAVSGADAPLFFTHPRGATAQQRFYRVRVD